MLESVVTRFPMGRRAVDAIKVAISAAKVIVEAVDKITVWVSTFKGASSADYLPRLVELVDFWNAFHESMKTTLKTQYPELCKERGPDKSYSASHGWPGCVRGDQCRTAVCRRPFRPVYIVQYLYWSEAGRAAKNNTRAECGCCVFLPAVKDLEAAFRSHPAQNVGGVWCRRVWKLLSLRESSISRPSFLIRCQWIQNTLPTSVLFARPWTRECLLWFAIASVSGARLVCGSKQTPLRLQVRLLGLGFAAKPVRSH
jgi:hypothetical protein